MLVARKAGLALPRREHPASSRIRAPGAWQVEDPVYWGITHLDERIVRRTSACSPTFIIDYYRLIVQDRMKWEAKWRGDGRSGPHEGEVRITPRSPWRRRSGS